MKSWPSFSQKIYWRKISISFSGSNFSYKITRENSFICWFQKIQCNLKKDTYLILFIKESPAKLESGRYFTEIYICQAFYQIRISKNSEDFTTFLTSFGAFKYLAIVETLIYTQTSSQHFINDMLLDFLYDFIQAYLNDIFIDN